MKDEVQKVIEGVRDLTFPSDIVGGSEQYGFQRAIDEVVRYLKRNAALAASAGGGRDSALAPIERDEGMNRTYIPLPGGWEVQTKGNGSTFRICDTKTGQRMPITGSSLEHDELERMAREIHAALEARDGQG